MAVITVSNSAQLSSALQVAKGGDTIQLSGGYYGDFTISAKQFAAEVSIVSASSGSPAVFNTLTVKGSENIRLDGLHVDLTPTATTYSFSSAVHIKDSSGITFANGKIEGGPAVNGVPASASVGDATGNVIGIPTGRGVTVQGSSDVVIEGSNLSQLDRGIVLSSSRDVKILGNEIHDTRQSSIVGGSVNDVVIDGNNLHSIHPWNWGSGDHADFIALWTDENTQATDSTGIVVTNNIMNQGDGVAVLGMWLKGKAGLGFSDVVIENNVIMNGNFQGITLGYVSDASVSNNTLIQTSGDNKDAPSILLKATTQDIVATGNIAWTVHNLSTATGSAANQVSGNTLIQSNDPKLAGYYGDDLVDKAEVLGTASAIHDAIFAGLKGGVIVAPPLPETGGKPELEVPQTPSQPEVEVPAGVAGKIIIGNGTANTLIGGDGNDTIDGRGGSDVLAGGKGNDTYIVPNSLARIVEKAGEGIDTVNARGDHTLGANIENLVLNNDAANGWSGTGNELGNVITGNAGANRLDGMAGSDTIDGGAGNDIIIGGAGADVLTGGSGVDTFRFGLGSGKDTITDFGVGGRDILDISAYIKAGVKSVVQEVGHDTVISFSSGDSITLVGIDADHVKAGAVGFVYT